MLISLGFCCVRGIRFTLAIWQSDNHRGNARPHASRPSSPAKAGDPGFRCARVRSTCRSEYWISSRWSLSSGRRCCADRVAGVDDQVDGRKLIRYEFDCTPRLRRRASDDQDNSFERNFGQSRRRALSAPAQGTKASLRERGRRRTRQDQISLGQRPPVKLRTSRSAPNEENLFLLPDRISERANSSKGRSDRLT